MSFLEAVGSDHNGFAVFGDERAGLGERVRVVGPHSGHMPLLALAVLNSQGYFHWPSLCCVIVVGWVYGEFT